MGSSKTASVSQPVVVSAAESAESARQAQQAELKRQGMASTILSSDTGSQTKSSILGG